MDNAIMLIPVSVILVAGGTGTRMGSPLPKQFLKIKDTPVLVQTVRIIKTALPQSQLIVVAPKIWMEQTQAILLEYLPDLQCDFAIGGTTRTDSVISGLSLVNKASQLIGIHDAVRPFVSEALIIRCFALAAKLGNAIPAVAAKDSYRMVYEDGSSEVLDRDSLRHIQTPQVFKAELLKEAYTNWPKDSSATDDASVFEAYGHKINLVEGEYTNIKLTTAEDLAWANHWVSSQ